MQKEEQAKSATFIGLLECPLHKGYIEFEYSAGDLVSELKKKVCTVWGPPITGFKNIVFNLETWVILCQQEDGSYAVLRDKDKIPIIPPAAGSSTNTFKSEAIYEHGVIEADDVIRSVRFVKRFKRHYKIPAHKYSVRLFALIALTGG